MPDCDEIQTLKFSDVNSDIKIFGRMKLLKILTSEILAFNLYFSHSNSAHSYCKEPR